jgi:filamentous hemagglutinin family protein
MPNYAETPLRAALKSSSSSRWAFGLLLAAPLLAGPAVANPLGGVVAAGTASISSPTAGQTKIDETSEDVVIDWSSFDIGAGQTTQFAQPNAQAIAVNRIGGSAPSQIMGNLDANGRVVLIDANGMVFGKGSQVNVGSLVATTTGGADSDVLTGKFTQSGNQRASIVNQGTINAGQGGFVALVAPHVSNSGTVSAKLGTVALGGATQFTVDFAGDGLVSFAAQGKGSASVTNSGALAGANVSLTARAAEGVATGVVNTTGMIIARGAREQGGTIVLDAGNGGDVAVSNANLNASGANGGGKVTIGGWNQSSVTIDKASIIDASATNSGNGGSIKTSAQTLAIGGMIDAGKGGYWLVDPVNLMVDRSAATTIDNSLDAGTNITLWTTAHGTSGPGVASSGSGDIVIGSALTWSTTAKLTLDAYHSIIIDAPVNVTGKGRLSMLTNHGSTGGDLSFDSGNITFQNLASKLSIDDANYILVNNIATLAGDIAGDPSGDYAFANNYNAAGDGTYTSSPIATTFSGIFEGLNHTVSNLSIIDTMISDNVGLFKQTAESSVVENFHLTKIDVQGAEDTIVGGLIASNSGLVMNASEEGSVSQAGTTRNARAVPVGFESGFPRLGEGQIFGE